jgi:hypothetical protein
VSLRKAGLIAGITQSHKKRGSAPAGYRNAMALFSKKTEGVKGEHPQAAKKAGTCKFSSNLAPFTVLK